MLQLLMRVLPFCWVCCEGKSSGQNWIMIRRIIVFLAITSIVSAVQPCLAEGPGEAEYNKGVRAYQKKEYKAALDYFQDAIKKGNRTPEVWLYSGHTFLALGKYQQAKQTYETVIKNFKATPAAELAQGSLEVAEVKIKASSPKPEEKAAAPPGGKPAAGGGAVVPPAKAEAGTATKPKKPTGLMARITITPPKMGHPAVSQRSIKAITDGVASLPPHLRSRLDDFGAAINVCPNMIDKWPESLNDLPEDSPEPTLAELPGRIYGREMFIYERPKMRASSSLKEARSAAEMRHTLFNCCTQLLDDAMTISKDPALRAEYEADKSTVPVYAQEKLRTFLKDDDWGPRETCAEIGAELLGQGDENTADLNRYFPRTRRWLKAKLGI